LCFTFSFDSSNPFFFYSSNPFFPLHFTSYIKWAFDILRKGTCWVHHYHHASWNFSPFKRFFLFYLSKLSLAIGLYIMDYFFFSLIQSHYWILFDNRCLWVQIDNKLMLVCFSNNRKKNYSSSDDSLEPLLIIK
jgi:hypothetical protein